MMPNYRDCDGTMQAMSEMTTLLAWVQWLQIVAQKIAIVGSAMFAGAILYRVRFGRLGDNSVDLDTALRALRTDARGPDRWLANIAAVTSLAAGLACLAGASMVWLVAALVEGLAAIYLHSEIRRTHDQLMKVDPAQLPAREWLDRWRGQQFWLALNAAWVPWLLVFQF